MGYNLNNGEFDTFSDLRLVAGSPNSTVKCLGRSAVNDDYWGLFYYNSTLTTSDDNLNIIKPTAVSGAGRWVRLVPINKFIQDFVADAISDVEGADFGGSITPSTPLSPTGKIFYFALQPGTYTNAGSVVVNANSFAVISYDGVSAWSISQTPISVDLSDYVTKELLGLVDIHLIDNDITSCTSTPGSLTRTWIFNDPIPSNGVLEQVRINATVAGDLALCEFKIVGGNAIRVQFIIVPLTVGINTITNFTCAPGNYIGIIQSATTYPGRIGFLNTTSPYEVYVFTTAVSTAQPLPVPQTTQRFGIEVITKDTTTINYRLSELEDSNNTVDIGNIFSRPSSPKNGETFFDESVNSLLVFREDRWVEYDGSQRYTDEKGQIINWTFPGTNLSDGGVSKTSTFLVNSETYTSNISYSIDVQHDTGREQALIFSTIDMQCHEFSEETVEFQFTRFNANSYFCIGDYGYTISRKVDCAYGVLPNNSTLRMFDRAARPGGWGSPTAQVNILPIINLSSKYRLIRHWYGGGNKVFLYDITTTPTLVAQAENVYINGYAQRPNNRRPCLWLNDVGVTITGFKQSIRQPLVTELMCAGDSISATRVATTYQKGFTKLLLSWYGKASYLEAGGSNQSQDIVNILPEMLSFKPKRFILMIGTNDIQQSTSLSTYLANMHTIVSSLENIGTEVIICKIIPADTLTSTVVTFNNNLDIEFPNNIIIDTFTPLANVEGTGWNTDYRGDALHPNDAGHLVLFNTIKPYL